MARSEKLVPSPRPLTTPGPWVVFFCDDKPHSILPAMRRGEICNFDHSNGTLEDARLIAAAPDLLEACKAVLRMKIVCPEDAITELEMCADAVAKAEYRDEDEDDDEESE